MDKPIIDKETDWFKPFMTDTPQPKATPKARYFEKNDEYGMLHAWKFTEGMQPLHLNVTHLHINALESGRKPTPDMDEITEAQFNKYKYDVLHKLDLI